MAVKKLVATTVSSRATGMQRRINQVTTSSHYEENKDENVETSAETSRIHISFKRKDSKKLYFTRVKKENKKEEKGRVVAGIGDTVLQTDGEAEAAKSEGLNTWRAEGGGKGSSSKASRQDRNGEPQEKTTFIVLQKNTRSLSSSERLEEMICELHCVE